MSEETLPDPPSHLSESAADLWRTVLEGYALAEHDLRTLELACTAWDRCTAARREIDTEGATTLDRFNQRRVHPAVQIEKDSRDAFLRAMRELCLDVDPPGEPGRPPGVSAKIKD